MGKDFGKTFRMEELDRGKWGRVVNKIFIGSSCQLYISFLAFFLASLTESCLFWYGLKGLFPLQKLADKIILDR